ncbi:MAG: hypothetical protein ABEJ73_01580 [Haloplanus sp.]
MASTTRQMPTTEEYCDECGDEQPVEISIAIVTESPLEKHAEFSREPYRITECLNCGATTETRMNDV